jgi:hypothetical protein
MGTAARVVVALPLAVLLAGCGTTPAGNARPAQLGSGALGSMAWSVTVYRSVEDGRCVQVHFGATDSGAVCQGTSDSLETSFMDDPAGQGSVAVVDIGTGGWTDGTVTLVDHETIPVATVTSGWGRFIVFAVPAPKTAEILELHNAVTGATEVRQLR